MNKKSNFNVPTFVSVIEEFNIWTEKVSGLKGDKVAGALRAIQALYAVDNDLALRLMQPDVTIKQAKGWIVETIIARESDEFLQSLSPRERRKVLIYAKAYKDKPSRNK